MRKVNRLHIYVADAHFVKKQHDQFDVESVDDILSVADTDHDLVRLDHRKEGVGTLLSQFHVPCWLHVDQLEGPVAGRHELVIFGDIDLYVFIPNMKVPLQLRLCTGIALLVDDTDSNAGK